MVLWTARIDYCKALESIKSKILIILLAILFLQPLE